ncbi:MAG: hypothetical protein CVV34_06480, partial [Methanomicrobiales archaeon HGW-Methanomicrobiales-5]
MRPTTKLFPLLNREKLRLWQYEEANRYTPSPQKSFQRAMTENILATGMQPNEASPFRHRYAVLFIVLVSVLMAVIDGTVVNIALPSMTRFFA